MSATTTTPHTPWPTVKLGDVCEASTGEELFAQIQAEKQALIKAGKLKKERPLPEITVDEIPFEIPETWKWVRIGDLGILKNGYSFKSDEYVESGVQVVRISDLGEGTVTEEDAVYYPLKKELDPFLIVKNSILICMTGSIGKMAWVKDDVKRYLNQRVGMFIPYATLNTAYLWFFLQNPKIKSAWDNVKTSTNGNIRTSDITNLLIPLPPPSEQREIVAKVEAGLKEADALAAHFKRLAALADETFKAELDETFSTLNAPTVKLGDVCEISRGRVMSKKYLAEHFGKYPVYSSQTKNEGVFGYIDTYDFDGEYLTWTTDGANAGSVFYHNGKFSITNVCGLLRVINNSIDARWLLQYLRTYAKSYVNKSMGNPKLMSNVVARIPIPLPSLDIQREIVGKLEAVKARCERLKAEAERGLKAAEALRKAVLAEAFEQ